VNEEPKCNYSTKYAKIYFCL